MPMKTDSVVSAGFGQSKPRVQHHQQVENHELQDWKFVHKFLYGAWNQILTNQKHALIALKRIFQTEMEQVRSLDLLFFD